MELREILAGRYRLGPVLGRGGMGAVHRAHDELLDRDVAVKLLDVEQAPQTAVQRFRREAQFLAGLSHPNVVTVFDFGADDAVAWLVMELLAGPTLQDLVNRHGPLPISEVRSYGRQCASALAAAHAAGITHRDVKPANLMLAADGTCKLLDLGIARLDGAATTQPALTQAGTILGTVPYLAPEVITGAPPEPPADMYALGGVLFALLTARPPFDAEDMMAAVAQHVHAPAPHPATVRADVPTDLDELVVGLLAKDPAVRPTAADVIGRLDGSSEAAIAPVAATAFPVDGSTRVLSPPVARTSAGPLRSRLGLVALGVALALALLTVVLVIANSGDTTNGSGGAVAGRARTTPPPDVRTTHVSRRSTTAPAPKPTPTARPADLPSALSALRAAITAAQADGGLAPAAAQDLLRRVDAMAAAGTGGGPAGGPHDGPGKPKEHGKAKGHPDPKPGGDLTGQLDDFARHLSDLRAHGAISPTAYDAIQSALASVRSFAQSSGGGDGGD